MFTDLLCVVVYFYITGRKKSNSANNGQYTKPVLVLETNEIVYFITVLTLLNIQ